MNRTEFKSLRKEFPTRRFCLHNGFAGFSFGSPSDPKWISFEAAYKLLMRYEKLTNTNPLTDFEKTWYCFSLQFNRAAKPLNAETGFRMMGFNEESECVYGDEGLG